jgi:hypothetical protein
MHQTPYIKQLLFSISICIFSCSTSKVTKPTLPQYEITDSALYRTVVKLDSIYFTAYNTCDMSTQEKMYSDSIEFYHDNGGLMTSKAELLESLRKYICNKVSRELVPGSVEVYPIKGFGAIEVGYHKFHNLIEKSTSQPGRFVIIWRNRNNTWQMTRVISLH